MYRRIFCLALLPSLLYNCDLFEPGPFEPEYEVQVQYPSSIPYYDSDSFDADNEHSQVTISITNKTAQVFPYPDITVDLNVKTSGAFDTYEDDYYDYLDVGLYRECNALACDVLIPAGKTITVTYELIACDEFTTHEEYGYYSNYLARYTETIRASMAVNLSLDEYYHTEYGDVVIDDRRSYLVGDSFSVPATATAGEDIAVSGSFTNQSNYAWPGNGYGFSFSLLYPTENGYGASTRLGTFVYEDSIEPWQSISFDETFTLSQYLTSGKYKITSSLFSEPHAIDVTAKAGTTNYFIQVSNQSASCVGEAGGYLWFQLRDEDDNLADPHFFYGAWVTNTYYLALESGKSYYVTINPDYWEDGHVGYSLVWSESPVFSYFDGDCPDTDTDTNDDEASATLMNLDQNYSGTVGADGLTTDVDVYRIDVP